MAVFRLSLYLFCTPVILLFQLAYAADTSDLNKVILTDGKACPLEISCDRYGNDMYERNNLDRMDCQKTCEKEPKCMAVTYNSYKRLCWIKSSVGVRTKNNEVSCGACYYTTRYDDLPTSDPTKEVIVQLFEWMWTDVAVECETFLPKYGYGAVQVSPATEHIKSDSSGNIQWWIKYQPISYKVCSRSGNEKEFKDMVDRCNKAGIRVIVDVVTNHMAGKGSAGVGWCGTMYNSSHDRKSFPGVPFNRSHFNDPFCDTDIQNYRNEEKVRKCRLQSLADINQDLEYTRDKITEYLNRLIDFGVAGFRVDAAKHQYPHHLVDMFRHVHDLNSSYFMRNTRPFVVNEIIDMRSNEGDVIKAEDYFLVGRVTNFIYRTKIANAIRRSDNFQWFVNFGEEWNMWNRSSTIMTLKERNTKHTSHLKIRMLTPWHLHLCWHGLMEYRELCLAILSPISIKVHRFFPKMENNNFYLLNSTLIARLIMTRDGFVNIDGRRSAE